MEASFHTLEPGICLRDQFRLWHAQNSQKVPRKPHFIAQFAQKAVHILFPIFHLPARANGGILLKRCVSVAGVEVKTDRNGSK